MASSSERILRSETTIESISSCTLETRKIIIAISTIVLIGSLVITGCLFSQLGYSSLAFAGGGVIIEILSIILSRYFAPYTFASLSTTHTSIENDPIIPESDALVTPDIPVEILIEEPTRIEVPVVQESLSSN